MSKIIWIISGPSVVGKSYLKSKNSDRLSEIVDCKTNKLEIFDPTSDEDEFNFLKRNESVFLYHIDLVHFGDELDNKKYGFKNLFSTPFEKKVIILGVPYNEYKERFQTLGKLDERKNKIKNRYLIHKKQVEWVDKLKHQNIPYIFVEAKNQYKILKEKEFFKMISYE